MGQDDGKVMMLDELVRKCGYFTDDLERPYGCDHPEQEEEDGDGRGSCHGYSCPIAIELNPETDFSDREYFGEDWKSRSNGEWVKVYGNYRPKVISKAQS